MPYSLRLYLLEDQGAGVLEPKQLPLSVIKHQDLGKLLSKNNFH
jgi:hypothetical protein